MNQHLQNIFGSMEPCLLKHRFKSQPRGIKNSFLEGHAPAVMQACKDENLNFVTVAKANWSILLHAYSRKENPPFAYADSRKDGISSPIMCHSALSIENDTSARQFFQDQNWQSNYATITEDLQTEALQFANTALVIELHEKGQNHAESQWQCLLKEVRPPS